MRERVIEIQSDEKLIVTVAQTHEEPQQPEHVTAQAADKGKLVYKVGLISDVHFDTEDSHNSEYKADLKNACEVFAGEGCEFVCGCGDFAQYNDADYDEFKDWYGAHGYARGLRLYTPLGNHDYLRLFSVRSRSDQYADDGALYNYIGMWNKVGNFHNILNPPDDKYESDIRFFEHGLPWDGTPYTGGRTTKSKLNYWFERHGDIYVCLSVDYGKMVYGDPWDTLARGINLLDYGDPYVKQMLDYVKDTPYDQSREKNFDYQFYAPEALIWLKGLVEDNRNKRIFAFMHHFLPGKAGDTFDVYKHLRMWPVPTSPAVKSKFYSGSNTVCGLTYWFLYKLFRENTNFICFGGHSHYGWKEQEDMVRRCYNVTQPSGKEVTPLVDDLNSLNDTEYDYQIYRTVGRSVCDSAPTIHIPSLSKPTDRYGSSRYGASEGGIMEVYERGVIIKCIRFKSDDSTQYTNEVVKSIEL